MVAPAEHAATITVSDWTAALSGARRDAALAAALDVAARITDRERLDGAIEAAPTQTALPRTIHWEPHSIAQGDAGLALACSHFDRCFPGAGWDVAAHDFLTSAARSVTDQVLMPGLFTGLAGLGFVAHQLSCGGDRYRRFSSSLETELVISTHDLAQRVRSSDGLGVGEFDVISGLSGIGGYLLAHRSGPPMGAALKHAIEALVALASTSSGTTPRWATPPELIADAAVLARYPHGSCNCGLAHGAPGPLALLSLAMAAGAPVAGLREATLGLGTWLADHRRDDEWGINWPSMVRLPESTSWRDEPSRAGWCYGAPGVARSLWLAGSALADDDLNSLAVSAMEDIYQRPVWARRIDSPTFCHGIAGLLQVTLRFLHDTGLPVFAEAADELTDQILAAYEPEDSLLGFRDVEFDGTRVDQAGLLDGAPGVALVLLAASLPVEPAWDRLFLLA